MRPVKLASCMLMLLLIAGCVGPRLRALQYRELTTELASITDTRGYLGSAPALGRDYAACVFLSGAALNQVLDGFTGITYPMKSPRGAQLAINAVRLEPRDGALAIIADAKAVSADKSLEVGLRVRADLVTVVGGVPGAGTLTVRPQLKEIVPTLKVSIFKFRLWWFVERLLLVKAQDYVDAMPSISVDVSNTFKIDLDGTERSSVIKTSDGTVNIKFHSPTLRRHYAYALKRVFYLREGAYLYFDIQDAP